MNAEEIQCHARHLHDVPHLFVLKSERPRIIFIRKQLIYSWFPLRGYIMVRRYSYQVHISILQRVTKRLSVVVNGIIYVVIYLPEMKAIVSCESLHGPKKDRSQRY